MQSQRPRWPLTMALQQQQHLGLFIDESICGSPTHLFAMPFVREHTWLKAGKDKQIYFLGREIWSVYSQAAAAAATASCLPCLYRIKVLVNSPRTSFIDVAQMISERRLARARLVHSLSPAYLRKVGYNGTSSSIESRSTRS